MCWKSKPILPMEYAERRLLSFAINDYPGSVNDLRGCLNDSRQAKDTLLTHWPDFDIRRYLDAEATVKSFKSNVTAAIGALKPGATVVVLADSCFSATVTRLFHKRGVEDGHIVRNRFYATPGEPTRPVARPFFLRSDVKWVAISACGEEQSAADAFINDAYHGAFSWYAFRLLSQGITYRHWFALIRQYLPSADFEQIPTIEGPDNLLDSLVFSNNTLIIHNSTHGTQLRGYGEEDIDEAICLYDGNIRDNEYFELLNKIF
jgi:hypothetical protein